MSDQPDDRIPLRFGALAQAGPQDALLLEGRPEGPAEPGRAAAWFAAGMAHRLGCACCGGRAPVAVALSALFQDRAKGRVPWFSRVLAVVEDAGAVAAELRADRVAASRFRVESPVQTRGA